MIGQFFDIMILASTDIEWLWAVKTVSKTLPQVWSQCVFRNVKYLSKCFAQIYRVQYVAAILVYLCGTPTWRPRNSVIIFISLWLSKRLIVCTQEACIYIRTFPNTLTSKMVKYHEIRICFFDKRFRSFMSRTVMTLKFTLRWFPEEADYSAEKEYTDINLPLLMSNEDKKH